MSVTEPLSSRSVLGSPEKLYALIALIALSGAFRPLFVGYADATETTCCGYSDPARIQVVLGSVYVVALALCLRQKIWYNARMVLPGSLILLIGYAAVSSAWSSAPDLTLKRFLPLLGSTLVGVYLASRFTLGGFLKVAFVGCFLITSASMAVGLAFPKNGIQPGGVFWAGLRGVFANKNELGWFAAFAALTSFYWIAGLWGQGRGKVWIGIVALALAALCLVHSMSIGSIIVAVITVAAVAALYCLQTAGSALMYVLGWVGLLLLCSLVLVGVVPLEELRATPLLEIFGRDATLTGRIPLWTLTMDLIAARPWLGYGYAVATAEHAPMLQAYFHVAHVHNGFLQVTLELGLLGLVLCLLFIGRAASACASLLMRPPRVFRSTFPGALLFLILLPNSIEVSLLYGQSLQWCLLVFVTVQAITDSGNSNRGSGEAVGVGAEFRGTASTLRGCRPSTTGCP